MKGLCSLSDLRRIQTRPARAATCCRFDWRDIKQKRPGIIARAFLSDLRRIQTCNLLSRNQVLYSVELGSHILIAVIRCSLPAGKAGILPIAIGRARKPFSILTLFITTISVKSFL